MATKAAFTSIKTVFPGETFEYVQGARFGDGIIKRNGVPTVSRAGILKYQQQTKYYHVFSDLKKYHPSVEDVCVGKIVKRVKDKYLVDIGSYCYAELDFLAFENATKKSKPNLLDGDYVYCRVVSKENVPQVVCVSQRKMEDGFGELQGGWAFSVPQSMCRRIMGDGCCVLTCIGEYTPFEIAVGINGMVWVRTPNVLNDVIVESCIVQCLGVVEKNVPGTIKLVWESWKPVLN
ncbi:hypothetical protein ENUP19_0010G0032 [Entamoeba nuttalli]|uniref:K Homology domain-containing protein n=1 Tax=Entamoeba nuttalli TaxID=412467 RepID=A0ABQ0D810_9EUKA